MPRARKATEFFTAEEVPAIIEEDLPSTATVHQSPTEMQLDFPISVEEIAKAAEALFLPNDWYVWHQGKCRITQVFDDRECAEGDKSPQGRMIFTVSGIATTIDTRLKGPFSFSFSPDWRLGYDEVRGDPRSETWGKCLELFRSIKERWPEGLQELIPWLQTALYQMYITRGTGRNYLRQLRKYA